MKLTIFKNGATAKLKNRRVEIVHKDNGQFLIQFIRLKPKDYSDKQLKYAHTCDFQIVKNVMVTNIHLSEEAMFALFFSYFKYQNIRPENFKKEKEGSEKF